MCLKDRMDKRAVLAMLPKGPFYAYKALTIRGGQLQSPVYTHKKWYSGTIVSTGESRGNGDSGIYVFTVDPGAAVTLRHAKAGTTIIRMKIDPADLVAGGVDTFGAAAGLCLVVRKVEVSKEDFEAACGGISEVHLEAMKVQADADLAVATEQAPKRAKKATAKVRKDEKEKTGKKKTAEKAAKGTAVRAMAKAAQKAKDAAKEMAGGVDLSNLSMGLLQAIVKDLGLKGLSKSPKATLIREIMKACQE